MRFLLRSFHLPALSAIPILYSLLFSPLYMYYFCFVCLMIITSSSRAALRNEVSRKTPLCFLLVLHKAAIVLHLHLRDDNEVGHYIALPVCCLPMIHLVIRPPSLSPSLSLILTLSP